MESYLAGQSSTIFQNVGVLIYVFDVESGEMDKDIQYYSDCLDALQKYSPEASMFLLIHKLDLVRNSRKSVLEKKTKEIQDAIGDVAITVFGTSIYDESLYKVRPRRRALIILYWLIPQSRYRLGHA